MSSRYKILVTFVIIVFSILLLRLFHIQVIDNSYKREAQNNVLRREILYPPRGEIYDRNGEFLAQSIACYDLMVVPKDVKSLDTLALAAICGTSVESLTRKLERAKNYSRFHPTLIESQLPQEAKLLFDEGNFQGFYTVYRSQRSYPRKIAGNLLGYIGEVSPQIIERYDYYRAGDYAGLSGIERAYEEVLRGEKGTKVSVVDVHGIIKGSYMDGAYDDKPIAGRAIVSTIDARLQELGEELMSGKVGSIIAIEPSTGEILMMVSSPAYDPDELVGRNKGNNYMALLDNKRQPLLNRGVMSSYPPGSTFKTVNGLIALQEDVLNTSRKYPCDGGFLYGDRKMKCHAHPSPLNLQQAIQMSCNAFFAYAFVNIMENRKYENQTVAFNAWREYVLSFGFGRKLDSDFIAESNGNVPSSDFYDRIYKTSRRTGRGAWNAYTIISLAIGQGELGVTLLQMANLGAIIANRGYYYIPHVVREIEGEESINERFFEKHYTMVDSKNFEPVVDGMYDAVHKDGGTARIAYIPGWDVCGKTGTVQNPHGEDHSTFICFAPKDNPKIAISVYVENSRWGATAAAPIASLLLEKYLTGEISRPDLVERMKNLKIAYPNYDK